MKKNNNKIGIYLLLTVILTVIISYALLWGNNHEETNAAVSSLTETQIDGSTVETGSNVSGGSSVANDKYGNSIVVWAGLDGTSVSRIFYRQYNSHGTPVTAPTAVDSAQTGNQVTPSIAMNEDGAFYITWRLSSTSNETQGVYLKAYNPDLSVIGKTSVKLNGSATNVAYDPSITAEYIAESNVTRVAVSYTYRVATGDDDVFFKVYNITAAPGTPGISAPLWGTAPNYETQINADTTGYQQTSDIAINNSKKILVAWTDANSLNIKIKLYDQDATVLTADTTISTASINSSARPSVAASKMPASVQNTQRFIIAFDALLNSGADKRVAIRRIACPYGSSCSLDPTLIIANESNPTSDLSRPDLSADYLGNFTVVWEHPIFGGGGAVESKDIKGQSFKYDGKLIGENFDVNYTNTTGFQTYPSISLNSSGTYNVTFTNENNTNAYLKKYVTEIFKVDNENVENSTTTGQQSSADTDISESGKIITVWKDAADNSIKFTLKDMAGTIIAQDTVVASGTGAANPAVSFFKDENGINMDNFVVVWQAQGSSDVDVYYRLYNASGSPANPAASLASSTSGDQIKPDVSAGMYPNFAAAWSGSSSTYGTFYNGTQLLEMTVLTCTASLACENPKVSLNETNNRVVFAYQKITDNTDPENPVIHSYARQALYDSTFQVQGNNFEIDGGNKSEYPDVTFLNADQYAFSYTNTQSTDTSIYAARYNYTLGSTPTSPVESTFQVTPAQFNSTDPSNSRIAADKTLGDFIIVWNDYPSTATYDNIYGIFYDYRSADSSQSPLQFGPVFQINSTEDQYQKLPSVAMNSNGHINVAWEGNIYQPLETPTQIDDYGIAGQMMHSPFITLTNDELEATCAQQITSGLRTVEVPATIHFPMTTVSTDEDQINDISIRAANNGNCGSCGAEPCACGGDTLKYIEITDETGQDFDFTVTASDFISAADNKAYMKNSEHFKIRNWDQDTTDTEASCATNPDKCFDIQRCTIPEQTTFSLDPSTESFVTLDQNRTLALKRGNPSNPAEIGKWRIYPEFELTVPKIIPVGNHSATITFTIN